MRELPDPCARASPIFRRTVPAVLDRAFRIGVEGGDPLFDGPHRLRALHGSREEPPVALVPSLAGSGRARQPRLRLWSHLTLVHGGVTHPGVIARAGATPNNAAHRREPLTVERGEHEGRAGLHRARSPTRDAAAAASGQRMVAAV